MNPHHNRAGRAWRIAGAIMLGLLACPPTAVFAGPGNPSRVSAPATLTIIGGTVQHVPAGTTQARPAQDGMTVALGDRVMTGPKSTALITFLDGSTLTVQPESDIEVRKADLSANKSNVSIKINLGTVWARVVRLADPKSSFALESNTATATVHDGLIGGEMMANAHFMCWTKAGALTVTDPQGQVVVVLLPGEKTMVTGEPGKAASPQAFSVNQSVLRVVTSAGVLPLVLMDDGVRVAGFVVPTIEVNQVFGSLTRADGDGAHVVEVPAGATGPFTVVVEGVKDGAFTVTLAGSVKGAKVYEQALSGSIKTGERMKTTVTQQLDPATVAERKTAKIQGGNVAPLEAHAGPLPGNVLLSPMELQTAGGM